MADSIGELKAIFEKQKLTSSHSPELAKNKNSPPLQVKLAKFEGRESPGVTGKLKEGPKVGKKLPLQPATGQKLSSPAVSAKPNPHSKPKPLSPSSTRKNDSRQSKDQPSTNSASPALPGALKSGGGSPQSARRQQQESGVNGAKGCVVKRPVPPPQSQKPVSNRVEGRVKSMDMSKASSLGFASAKNPGRFSSSFESSYSGDELQSAATATLVAKPHPVGGALADDKDVESTQNCKISSESTKVKKPTDNGVKPPSTNNPDVIEQKKQAVSIICGALSSPALAGKKPHSTPPPPPIKPSHNLSPEHHDSRKPRSVTESPNPHSPTKLPLIPKPAPSGGKASPAVSRAKPDTKPAVPGSKPMLPGGKPTLPVNKPTLPVNKPTLGKPSPKPVRAVAANSGNSRPVSSPVGTKQLPTPPTKIGSSSSSNSSSGSGVGVGSVSSPNKRSSVPSSSPVKTKPLPPVKTTQSEEKAAAAMLLKESLANVTKPSSPRARPTPPVKPAHNEETAGPSRDQHPPTSEVSPQHKVRPTPPLKHPQTKETTSPLSKSTESQNSQDVSTPAAEPEQSSTADLEETLTNEQEKQLPTDKDFEKTVEEDSTGAWVVVGGKGAPPRTPPSANSPGVARKLGAKKPPVKPPAAAAAAVGGGASKPHPSSASSSPAHSEQPEEEKPSKGDSTPSSIKPLPTPPAGGTKEKSTPLPAESESTASPKISALKNIFSHPSPSSSFPSTQHGRVESPKSPKSPALQPPWGAKSPALHGHAPPAQDVPPSSAVSVSGDSSPRIRIIPGSFSKTPSTTGELHGLV